MEEERHQVSRLGTTTTATKSSQVTITTESTP
jgi:hypothetical protein